MLKQIILYSGCVGLLWSAALFANPEEDTKRGLEALLDGDTIGAMRLYRQAAEQGYAPAQVELANILDKSELNDEALHWFQKAAEQNNAEGQYGLGVMYLTGDDVEKDIEHGLELIQAAANQDLIRAMISMFETAKNGEQGRQVDLKQALSWLEKIAALGNQWAIETIANAHRKGDLGLTASDEKASFWEGKLQTRAEQSPAQ